MSNHLPAARLARVLQYVDSRGHASVTELAEEFNVSRDTARRDIDKLTEQGLASRTHGGIVAAKDLAGLTTSHTYRATENMAAKKQIGKLAADLIHDGETIFVAGGTTTLEVVRALHPRRELTIVTNSLLVPSEVPAGVAREVLLIGGRFNTSTLATSGPLELPGLTRLMADRAFVSVGGISAHGDFSVASAEDAVFVRKMITNAKVPVIVADSAKFNREVFARTATLEDIAVLVCEEEPTGDLMARVTESSVQLVTP